MYSYRINCALPAANSSEIVREHFWALGSPCYQGPCVQMECVILQGGNGPAWKLANCADQHHFICTKKKQQPYNKPVIETSLIATTGTFISEIRNY